MLKKRKLPLAALLILSCAGATAQSVLVAEPQRKDWTAYNRKATFTENAIYLNQQADDGLLWLNDANFKNGTIELELRGRDLRGKSFVGIAFHGKDDETFDCIYFRPFNFRSPERKSHSVQYISAPDNGWKILREKFPGKYENEIDPAPAPEEWLHAKIVLDYPVVKVYVNNADKPSLEVEQISDRREGKFGLWVGNGSDGWFRNITLKNAN
ncbi:DUF1080 domain-containing protein [Fulvivirgaceae bacterium BMA12]|uniref:DUF1080 domain-containing protein n=1 Tax=Agaribacillus aureus TaxID=3051825 RepID=A0ABT8L5Z8_9BACT|nr:DUF1080 domain-containing protein [Fulvivirgaceae bacterium BMA12]